MTATPDINITVNINGLGDVTEVLQRMENSMATAAAQLAELKVLLADTTADVLAKLEQLTTQLGELSPEAQATLDEIKTGVQDLDTAVGDADGSDTQPL
jgi:hypothetical protein